MEWPLEWAYDVKEKGRNNLSIVVGSKGERVRSLNGHVFPNPPSFFRGGFGSLVVETSSKTRTGLGVEFDMESNLLRAACRELEAELIERFETEAV